MCKVNKNATYKKIFEALEVDEQNAYSNLPEETIAHRIYKLRMLRGCTQREFSKICNIGYSSLCKYEIGYNPSAINLKKICNSLDIDISYFIKQEN